MQQSRSSAIVLVVDDNPASLDLLSDELVSEGLEVTVASNGDEVFSVIGHTEPDLILLDVLMPGVDGFETCRSLKADPATRDIPVIFMTALAETRSKHQGFQAGAVDYVTKPFDRVELLARVRTHTALRRATRAMKEQNERLSEQVRDRIAAEQALAEAVEKLREANAQLSQELSQRALAEVASAALQEQIIAVQRERLLELSAPLIPIAEGVLVMPLVGTMDVERARQAVETALRGAAERSVEYLIIDITGVKWVNETVASLLVDAARGLGLLGTRAVITGIRSEVAQTLVGLSLPLNALVTKGTLQAGVEHALRARRAVRHRRA